MLGYNDLLSRQSIEMNTIREQLSHSLDKKIVIGALVKKSYIIVVIIVM